MNAPESALPTTSEVARPNYFQIFVLGFAYFGVSLIWSIYLAFIPTTLEKKFGFSSPQIGFYLSLDSLIPFFIQTPIGVWSDRLRTPIGRRLPFVLVGGPLAAIAFGLIPHATTLLLFIPCTVTLLFSMAIWRTPAVALVGDLVPSQFRSQANGIVNFMGGLGAIFAYFEGANLAEKNPAYPFWMGTGLIVVVLITVFACIREPKLYRTSKSDAVAPAQVGVNAPAELPLATEVEPSPRLIASLRALIQERDRSVNCLLLAIFCWMVGYSAIETFFPLYTVNYLHLKQSDGPRLLGQVALFFVLFALPSGYLGGIIGRRLCVKIGIVMMTVLLLALHFLPITTLLIPVLKMPILGVVPVVGILLMLAGIAWALINIHAWPMLVDMADSSRLGTYTGLYYLFSSAAAILGPNLNGWIVQLNGKNYNAAMMLGAICMGAAFVLMLGVSRGEARPNSEMAVELAGH